MYWKNYADTNLLVHLNWVKFSDKRFCQFKDLWGISEAEANSWKYMPAGIATYSQPVDFSKELVLSKYGILKDIILDVLNSLIEEGYEIEQKINTNKTVRVDKVVPKDLSKSPAVASFQEKVGRSNFSGYIWSTVETRTETFWIDRTKQTKRTEQERTL